MNLEIIRKFWLLHHAHMQSRTRTYTYYIRFSVYFYGLKIFLFDIKNFFGYNSFISNVLHKVIYYTATCNALQTLVKKLSESKLYAMLTIFPQMVFA